MSSKQLFSKIAHAIQCTIHTVSRYALPHQTSTPGGLLNGGSHLATLESARIAPSRGNVSALMIRQRAIEPGYRASGSETRAHDGRGDRAHGTYERGKWEGMTMLACAGYQGGWKGLGRVTRLAARLDRLRRCWMRGRSARCSRPRDYGTAIDTEVFPVQNHCRACLSHCSLL